MSAPDTSLSADLSAADRKAQQRNRTKIDRAIDAVEAGKPNKAKSLAMEVLADGRITIGVCGHIVRVLQVVGENDLAEQVTKDTAVGLEAALEQFPDDPTVWLDVGMVMQDLQLVDRAKDVLARALKLNPQDSRAGLPLVNAFLKDGEVDELLALWRPALATLSEEEFRGRFLFLAKGLGHFGFADQALALIEEQRANWVGDTEQLDKLVARLQNTDSDTQDLAEASESFDNFSEFYDSNLAALDNRGPLLIGSMIERLGWTPDKDREILDAGCGTGLCGPYLRGHAKTLHGCDLSIGMLEKAKERNLFDLLTRTDVTNPTTYPEGIFSDVIAADVLVYFGDLEGVLKNFAAKMKPGGTLIFTVEDGTEQDPARGFERYVSGRFRHTEAYLDSVLPKAGFTKPKHILRETLRHEFGAPIPGLCVAVQKLAFTLG